MSRYHSGLSYIRLLPHQSCYLHAKLEYTLDRHLTAKGGRSDFQSGRKLWFAAIAFLMNDQSVMHMVESKVW